MLIPRGILPSMSTADRLATLSPTMQMYLKTIHTVQLAKGAARVTDISRGLDVRKASVTSALRTLSELDLVNYAPYEVITLTNEGEAVATEVEQRYKLLREFFSDVLGIDPITAHDDACTLEHHLSETLYKRLVGFIEYYEACTDVRFRWNAELGGYCLDDDAPAT